MSWILAYIFLFLQVKSFNSVCSSLLIKLIKMLILRKNITPLFGVNFYRALYSTTTIQKETKTKVGKYDINYVKVGNGKHNVLCAPGALGTIWSEFEHQIQGFNRDQFSLVVWDPPGYGKSCPPEKDFSVDFLEKDADMAYEFMKALQIPKFSVLGFSDGGITSLMLAAKYPSVVHKLVVWGTNSFILPNELEAYKKIKDVNKWSKRMAEPMIEIYGKERFAKYWASWVDAMDAIYQANNGNICSDKLKNIKCPTFILYGEKDPIVDCVHVSHLHTHIERSRIHLYPEGKHHIHLKYAEDFNKRVQEFLLHH